MVGEESVQEECEDGQGGGNIKNVAIQEITNL